MSKTYADIQNEIKALQVRAQALRQKEVAGVVARIKQAIEAYGITSADLGLDAVANARPSKAPASAKGARSGFADGQGNTWSGRGPRPKWLKQALATGRSLEDFAVTGSSAGQGGSSGASAKSSRAKATRRKVAAKYRDGSGNSWSGRGSQPRWLKEALTRGEKLESFAI